MLSLCLVHLLVPESLCDCVSVCVRVSVCVGGSVGVLSPGLSTYKIISSANSGTLLLLFRFGCLLCLFSCQIVLTRTSSTMLNGSGNIRLSCFVPDLRGEVFTHSPLSIIFTIGFSDMALIS
jgi:hypothetical protein